MTIDFHAHPVPDAFRKWLPLLDIDVIVNDGFPLPQWSKEAHLRFMDDAGIDYTVLSLPTPHIHRGDDEKSLQAAMEINDELASLKSDRFGWTACLLASMGMMETVDARAEFEKLYFDIAGDPEPVALDMLRMVAADDHIVFGSDFPHSPANVILMKKAHFDGNPRWDGIRERIYSGNGFRAGQALIR